MLRKAFVMQVHPDKHELYRKRHAPVWPKLEDVLKSHGVHNYSIFLDEESSRLFAYAEIESQRQWERIAQTTICKRWWAHMKDIMPTNADNSPVSKDLEEVFHLD